MKTSKLFGLALLAISFCFTACDEIRTQAGINADLDGDGIFDGTNPSTPSIRPYKIDMDGVQGFAIVKNTSNAPRTKADINGDGVDEDMPNGNVSEAVNTSPHALYTIDENGELHVSIFYFEVVQSEDGSTDAFYTEVLKEVSNALQIVPSLVTDFGKYILFSGCEYYIVDTEISDESLSICETFIKQNYKHNMVYMIRKADGALFDLSDQPIFRYAHSGNYLHLESNYRNDYDPTTGKGARWTHIPEFTYTTSSKDNLFIRGDYISKIEDNGNSITVKQMTLYANTSPFRNFAIDNDENIYDIFYDRVDDKVQIDIYTANSGYSIYEPEVTLVNNVKQKIFDVIIDESGIPYIFVCGNYKIRNNGVSQYAMWFLSTLASGGTVTTLKEDIVKTTWKHNNTRSNYHYLGYYNDCFNWYLYHNQEGTSILLGEILSYNNTTHKWSLNQIESGIMSIISANYDAFIGGKISYGINLDGNDIEVTEIDIISESTRKYTLTVDIPPIVSPSYNAQMVQGTPYFTIDGRNTINGAGISITVNLINGENNSTFASDTRKIITFFRIN